MNYLSKQTLFSALLLFCLGLFAAYDLLLEFYKGESSLHLFLEGFLATVAFGQSFYLCFTLSSTKIKLEKSHLEIKKLALDNSSWKAANTRLIQGLSESIDKQLEDWKLSAAEKDVALLLLKGLSFKDIAEHRHTAEKTARQQALMVYQKSGLPSRSELSAFFLEDLLISPSQSIEL